MFHFQNSEYLFLLLLVLPLLYFFKPKSGSIESQFSKEVLKKIRPKSQRSLSKRVRNGLMLLSMALVIVALARPQIDNGEVKVKSSFIDVVVAIDMSKSMFANDVYPSRFEFAKKKFFKSLKHFKKSRIALIGFSSQTFLISPLTQDFNSLKFLAKNLSLEHLSLKGTDIMATLESANNLFNNDKRKALLLFTDGSDQSEFTKEIAYAKEHNIVVYIYNIGTTKGGVIKDENGVLKDKNGNIVVVKRTDQIKELSIATGGAYMNYSLAQEDVELLAQTIESSFQVNEAQESSIKDRKELFYYPLAFAMLLLFMALFSLPKGVKNA